MPYKADFNARDYPVNKERMNFCGASLRAFVRLGMEQRFPLVKDMEWQEV